MGSKDKKLWLIKDEYPSFQDEKEFDTAMEFIVITLYIIIIIVIFIAYGLD